MGKILHFVCDRKYIDSLVDFFSEIKSDFSNEYVLCQKRDGFINIKKHKSQIILIDPSNFREFIQEATPEAIILHDFSSLPFRQINEIPKTIPVFWVAWGTDIYSDGYIKPLVHIDHIYNKHTKSAISRGLVEELRYLHGKLYGVIHKRAILKAINRVDYFSGVYSIEYDLMKKNHFFRAKYFEFNYPSNLILNKLGSKRLAENVLGDGILIGNSGDPTNNHIDAYLAVRDRCKIGNRIIYSFLSYGGTPKYINKVICAGERMFGSRYRAVTSFLPPTDYDKVIIDCRNVIMFHERQQAVGNILYSLLMGCNVFLSKTSVSYSYFKNKGFKIYSVQDDLTEETLNSIISDEEINRNREIIDSWFGAKKLQENVLNLNAIIENECQAR